MSIKYSVVMPCYNAEKYIQHAIESVANQTYKNFELIVVDGGSTDGTLDILKKNEMFISTLISEPDRGQSDAFNKGFKVSKGKFCLWLNADDLLAPHMLEYATIYLEKNIHCRWLACNTIYIDKDGLIKRFHYAPPWNSLLNINHRPQVECPTSIFHKELLEEAGGFDLRLDYSMDLDLWRTFISKGHKWDRLKYYGYIFRIHDDSKTNKETDSTVSSLDQIVQGEILRDKHNIKINRRLMILSKLLKIIYCLPNSFISKLYWRNVPISSYLSDRQI
jgi:glycosyltransferase involved in cell wall biosynthesis